MTFNIPAYELAEMLERAAEAGANRVLEAQVLIKTQVSQRQAYIRYGETKINRWRLDGKITPTKIGGIIYYPTAKLEILNKTNSLYGRGIKETGRPDLDGEQSDSRRSGHAAADGRGNQETQTTRTQRLTK
jgi:hypothetical protein